MSHPVKVLPLALALALGPGSAFAMGLGPIEVKSQLNQPLLAEIPLIGAAPADLDVLSVRLAAPEAFERVGLPAPAGVTANLQFSVGRNARGEPVVRVTTANRVEDPFVSFLLQADWGKGSVVREFTVLVDPPHIAAATVAPVRAATVAATPPSAPAPVEPVMPPAAEPAASAPEASPAPTEVLAAPEPAARSEPIAADPAPEPVAAAPAPAPAAAPSMPSPVPVAPPPAASPDEHRVEAGDTLWSIAASRRGDVSAAQMMLAIQRANPEAFARDNINLLRKGAVLRIPTSAQAEALARVEAESQVRDQMAAWRALSGAPSPTPTPVEGEGATAASAPTRPSTSAPERVAASAPTPRPSASSGRLEIAPPSGAGPAAAQSGAAAGGSGSELRAELQQAREDLSARDAELRDLQSRLAEQEALANEQKRLIELKDSQLSALEEALRRQREGEGEAAAPTPPSGIPVETPASPAEVAAPASTAAPVASPTPAADVPSDPVPTASAPWWQQPWVLGAGGLLLVGGLVGVLLRRRAAPAKTALPVPPLPKSRLSDDPDLFTGVPAVDPEPVPAPPSAEVPGSAESGPGPAVEGHAAEEASLGAATEARDLVSSAVEDPAFAPLRDDVQCSPTDLDAHVGLLRQLYNAGDAAAFLAAAEAMRPHVAENGDPRWREVVVMGMGLVPGHALFREVLWNPVRSTDVQTREAPARAVPADTPAPEVASFDASITAQRPAMSVAPPPAEGLDDTRLELAKAYIEIGDTDGARGMLEEVLLEGQPAAREEAARLLAQLG